jgi:nitrate reductase molybdenum cofactor assembly chaperone
VAVLPVRRDLQAQSEDGIVLVDQDVPRLAHVHHRLPVQEGLLQPPHRQGREVHLLLPAHRGRPADGVLRDLRGPAALHRLILYDADRVTEAAATEDEQDLYEAQLDLLPRPDDPRSSQARRDGIPEDWMDAAEVPVYALIKNYKVALPLHPEYRTMPMVWYIPPLSPVVDALKETGHDAEDAGNLFGAIDTLRIPSSTSRNLFTAGDVVPVKRSLRSWPRCGPTCATSTSARDPDARSIPEAVGMDEEEMYEMYRLLAIAKYEDRYVIPRRTPRQAQNLEEFDLSRRHALHLTYWTDGDTRRRGEVLAAVKQTYRDSGLLVDLNGELPDYLPMVLEFAAQGAPAIGVALLNTYRASLELLRIGLTEDGLPQAGVVAALCASLGGPSPQTRAEVQQLHDNPPTELVGLDGFLTATPSPARRLSLTDATRQGD